MILSKPSKKSPFSPAFTLATFILFLLTAGPSLLLSETLNVPREYPTIKAAVYEARAGDVILVDDGVYQEVNIIVDKAVLVRSKNLYGAVVFGSKKSDDCIFNIRGAATIEGFVFKRGTVAILQRHSSDVLWYARNLAFFDVGSAISVNDVGAPIGSATVRNVFISNAGSASTTNVGISTNDANSMDVAGVFLLKCATGFQGSNHLSFRVDETAAVDCGGVSNEDLRFQPGHPGTSRIDLGKRVHAYDPVSLGDPEMFRLMLISLDNATAINDPDWDSARGRKAAFALRALALGQIFLSSGKNEDATRSFRTAYAAAEETASPEFMWQALAGLAVSQESRNAPDEAAKTYRVAIDLVERWATRIPTGIFRLDFLEDKTIAYEKLIGLLLDRPDLGPSGSGVEEAFLYGEKLKALIAFRIPGAGKASSSVPGSSGLTEAKKAKANEISRLQLELQNPRLSNDMKNEMCSLLEEAEEDYHGLLISAEQAAGTGGTEVPAQGGSGRGPRTVADIRALRENLSGLTVIEYVLGTERSFAFLATEDGIAAARLPERDKIERALDGYLDFLQLEGEGEFRGSPGGHILHDILLGPFEENLRSEGAERVLIVPDGRLSYLPFETLVEADAGSKGGVRFWGEGREIVYAPTMAHAVSDRGETVEPGTKILLVGNSGGMRCDNRSRNLKQYFFPLSHVKREIRNIAGKFRDADVTILLDRDASERRLKDEDLGKYGVVHVATHGVLDDIHWWRSALLLEPQREIREDGFLTALEVAELHLDARLVVLSACRTGLASLATGEGIKGFVGAFLHAGADNLLVSLWNVDDRAAAEFMRYFYEFLGGGETPSRALWKAKLRMIEAGYRNPYYWASFVLIGKAGP